MIKIAPSVLSADFANLVQEINTVQQGGAEYLHLDVMDGHFVPNMTFGPILIKALRPHSDLVFDVHLMIEQPEKYIEAFAEAGADIITVHTEATTHVHRALQMIKKCGKKAGVAYNPGTSVDNLPYLVELVDLVLLMSVNPGFGGQKFIEDVLGKISIGRGVLDLAECKAGIGVDGGINIEAAALVSEAGAGVLVAGSAVFQAESPAQMIKKIRQSALEVL
ncbi:MAG: ribulose-phosphate 3-epimerase [Clostridia bacterium]|nr:ribulose-phosphate 3-epimerase [Clostridia bacterium]